MVTMLILLYGIISYKVCPKIVYRDNIYIYTKGKEKLIGLSNNEKMY